LSPDQYLADQPGASSRPSGAAPDDLAESAWPATLTAAGITNPATAARGVCRYLWR